MQKTTKVDHEERFYNALKRITRYQTPAQLERTAEKKYGLTPMEALEMAYENVIEEAKSALHGYRRKPAKKVENATSPVSEASPTVRSVAP